MSELIEGLKKIRALQEAQAERERARQEVANRVKADWFKWPKGVTTCAVTFLKEFDEESPGYKEEQNGKVLVAVEHEAPGPLGYTRRGLCTKESEGACYPDERHRLDPVEGWRPRTNLYVDALVDFGDGEKKHLLIQRNFNSAFAQSLIDEAVDEGSITNNRFKITKSGTGTSTQWLLKRQGEPFDTSGVTPYNLKETAIRSIPYAQQPEYYGSVYQEKQNGGDDEIPLPDGPTDHAEEESW